MDQGRRQYRGSLKRSAPASTPRGILPGVLVAVAVLLTPWIFTQAHAQQRADQYAGYSPSSKAEDRTARTQAAKKQAAKKQAAKKQAAKKQAAKKSKRAGKAKAMAGDSKKVVAKARAPAKRDALAAKSSTARSQKVANAAKGAKRAGSRDARLKRAQMAKSTASKSAAATTRRTAPPAQKSTTVMRLATLAPNTTTRSAGSAGKPAARLQSQSTAGAAPRANASAPLDRRPQAAATKSAPAANANARNPVAARTPGRLAAEAQASASAAAKTITPVRGIIPAAGNSRVAEGVLANPTAAASTNAARRATGVARRAVAAPPSEGIGGPWAGLTMMIGALGAFLFFRRPRPQPQAMENAPHIDPTMHMPSVDVAAASQQVKADLMQRAEPFFVDLRNASVRQDHDFILQHCTEDMATALILDSAVAETPAEPHVEGLRAELVDLFEEVNRYVASVQYTADELQGGRRPRKVNEVWHFVREPEAPDWRLAAVEPG